MDEYSQVRGATPFSDKHIYMCFVHLAHQILSGCAVFAPTTVKPLTTGGDSVSPHFVLSGSLRCALCNFPPSFVAIHSIVSLSSSSSSLEQVDVEEDEHASRAEVLFAALGAMVDRRGSVCHIRV